jgi:hypothetical protein
MLALWLVILASRRYQLLAPRFVTLMRCLLLVRPTAHTMIWYALFALCILGPRNRATICYLDPLPCSRASHCPHYDLVCTVCPMVLGPTNRATICYLDPLPCPRASHCPHYDLVCAVCPMVLGPTNRATICYLDPLPCSRASHCPHYDLVCAVCAMVLGPTNRATICYPLSRSVILAPCVHLRCASLLFPLTLSIPNCNYKQLSNTRGQKQR